MNFLEELKSAIEQSWKDSLLQSSFWTHLTRGDLSREQYASYLRETYHYTRRSALIQMSTLPHFQIYHRNWAKPFIDHASEEESHYRLCLLDLKNLNINSEIIEQSNPLPATEGYLGFIFNRINFVNPVAYLGYLFHLEYLATKLGPLALASLEKLPFYDKRIANFLRVHIEEDVDHVAELSKLIDNQYSLDPLTESDRREILYSAKTASALYAMMLESSFHNPYTI